MSGGKFLVTYSVLDRREETPEQEPESSDTDITEDEDSEQEDTSHLKPQYRLVKKFKKMQEVDLQNLQQKYKKKAASGWEKVTTVAKNMGGAIVSLERANIDLPAFEEENVLIDRFGNLFGIISDRYKYELLKQIAYYYVQKYFDIV